LAQGVFRMTGNTITKHATNNIRDDQSLSKDKGTSDQEPRVDFRIKRSGV
jgi:hypothetical protein